MKKVSLIIVFLIMVCSMVFAQDVNNKSDKNKMQVKAPQTVLAENKMKQPSNNANPKEPVLYKKGCCSHHGGVCGCDSASGRQKCCDGTLSPSCRCSD